MTNNSRLIFALGFLLFHLGSSNGWMTTKTSVAAIQPVQHQRWLVHELRGPSRTRPQQQQQQRQRPRSVTVAVAAATVQNLPAVAPGLPQELDELALFESIFLNNSNQTVERVSVDPPIFIWRNALTPEQCLEIRERASYETEMEQGKTVACKDNDDNDNDNDDDDEANDIGQEQNENDTATERNQQQQKQKQQQQQQPRKLSNVGWLSNEMPLVETVARNGHGVFLNGMPFHATRGIEPLQVVHYYDVGGEYVNHHDGNNRLLTVLYYLNGVGETWFPLADINRGRGEGGDPLVVRDSTEARLVCRDKSPGRDGVLVTCRHRSTPGRDSDDDDDNDNDDNDDDNDDDRKNRGPEQRSGPVVARVQQGDAVAFYNYNSDGSMNWNALHSGLPITQKDLASTESNSGRRSDSDTTTTSNKSNNENDEKELGGATKITVSRNDRGKWIANHFYHFVPSYVAETRPPPESNE